MLPKGLHSHFETETDNDGRLTVSSPLSDEATALYAAVSRASAKLRQENVPINIVYTREKGYTLEERRFFV